MYTVITHYDDWENRPYDEVNECYTKDELKELLEEIGPDQNTPIKVQTRIIKDGTPVYVDEIMKGEDDER